MGPDVKHQSRIVVVTRETRMEGLLQRWGTKGQVRYYIGQARAVAAAQAGRIDEAVQAQKDFDHVFVDLEREHGTYHDAVKQLTRQLDFGLPVQVIDRTYLPTIDFQMYSVVVVVGQDGLVANTAKYVGDVPIVAVNPDPARIDGVLLPFRMADARAAVLHVLKNQARFKEVTLAQATLHDGQSLLAFNDLFIGAASHVSARYELRIGHRQETQSSSGLLVSTGAGSTGWMSSVFNMTRGVSAAFGQSLDDTFRPPMDWDASWLMWVVREPFLSRTSGVSLVAGRLNEGENLIVESRMPTGGVIFSDGIESDFLTFNGGAIVTVERAKHRARLVVPRRSLDSHTSEVT